MADQVRTLSVRAIMDSSGYERAAAAMVAANKSVAASGNEVQVSIAQTDAKLSAAGDGLTKLVNKYDPAARAVRQFQQDLVGLNKNLESGKTAGEAAVSIYTGMVAKLGLMADGAQLAEQGFSSLATVVSAGNANIRAHSAAVDELAASYKRMAAEARAAQAADNAQSNFNRSFGFGQPIGASASDSASVFEEQLRLQEAAASRQQELARLRAQQDGGNFAADLNSRLGIGGNDTSALASASAFEEAAREADMYAQKADALKAVLDPIAASQARLNAELAEYGILLNRREIDLGQFAKAEALARARHDQLVASLDDTPGGPSSTGDRDGMFRRQNMIYQAFDISGGMASGQSMGMIAAQQAPQILQEYAAGGVASIKEDLIAVKGAALAAYAAIGPLGLAFGVAAIAAGAFYFLTREETKSTEEVLKEHAENIKAMGDAYGIAEEKAKSYSSTDRAIAAAKAHASAEDLAQKQQEARLAATGFPFGQHGEKEFGSKYKAFPEYRAFEAPLAALRLGTISAENFEQQINQIGEATGMEEQARKITLAIDQLQTLNTEATKQRDLLTKIGTMSLPSLDPLGIFDQDKEQTARANRIPSMIEQQRAQLEAMRKQVEAQSPQEKADAAIAGAEAQVNSTESTTDRADRIELAGKQALISAEHALKQAKEDRQRSSQASLEAAQNELSLIGKTIAEQNRLRAEYQATASIREIAARDGVAADEKEIAAAKAKAAAIAQINAQVSMGKMTQDQGDQIEQLQLEASLIGASARERARATAALQAEQQMRQQGIDLQSREAEQYKANAVAMADARLQIERQQAAYQSLQQVEGGVIDHMVTGTGTLKERLRSAADDMLGWFQQIAIANPLKNAIIGDSFTFQFEESP